MKNHYLALIIFPVILFSAGSLFAQKIWEQNKGNCEMVFKDFEQAKINELKTCVGIWEAYRDVSSLKEKDKQSVAKAMNRLYLEGDEESQFIAKNALTRLGFPPPERAEKKETEEVKKPARKPYNPPEASAEDQKKAEKIRNTGMKLYKKGDYKKALEYFDQALLFYGGYVQALYDAACSYGALGNGEMAVEYLRRILDVGGKKSVEKIRKARVDKDFDKVKDREDFKVVTGYARIKVLNGMSEDYYQFGEDAVKDIEKALVKLNYSVAEKGKDKHERDRAYIWYRPYLKTQALFFAKLINHPKTTIVVMDWNSDFDIIISWADKPVQTKDGEVVMKETSKVNKGKGVSLSGVKDPDKQMDDLYWEEDNALKKPDEYARKTEHVVTTPDRTVQKTEQGIRRIENTGKKIDGALDKTMKLFGK
jgi:tetratricopeptide (TPR) repeat protein